MVDSALLTRVTRWGTARSNNTAVQGVGGAWPEGCDVPDDPHRPPRGGVTVGEESKRDEAGHQRGGQPGAGIRGPLDDAVQPMREVQLPYELDRELVGRRSRDPDGGTGNGEQREHAERGQRPLLDQLVIRPPARDIAGPVLLVPAQLRRVSAWRQIVLLDLVPELDSPSANPHPNHGDGPGKDRNEQRHAQRSP